MTSIESYNDGGYYATLLIGEDERGSAKKRRQQDYAQDLELQMREKNAARQREKLQDMRVNASGWLDPEKGPERLKPLGGHDFLTTRRVRDSRAKPYHTLFSLDQPKNKAWGKMVTSLSSESPERQPYFPQNHIKSVSAPLTDPPRRNLDPNPGIFYQPLNNTVPNFSYEPTIMSQPMHTAPGNLVPPLTITQRSPRPVVINHQPVDTGSSPRFNPFQYNSGLIEMKSVLHSSMLENDRIRARIEQDNADYHRRLERDREEDQRRIRDIEAELKRKIEEMRREEQRRRMLAEMDRREAERIRYIPLPQKKTNYEAAPDLRVIRPQSPKLYNLDAYRQQLREERRKIEELLKSKTELKKGMDLHVIKHKENQLALPSTPQSPDLANKKNVEVFSDLKHKDMPYRQIFRGIFPDIPYTNKKLEWQQAALLKQQEETLRNIRIEDQGKWNRKKWLEMYPWTPNVKQERFGGSRVHTARLYDERSFGDGKTVTDFRSSSRETLLDDTWLRPSTANM